MRSASLAWIFIVHAKRLRAAAASERPPPGEASATHCTTAPPRIGGKELKDLNELNALQLPGIRFVNPQSTQPSWRNCSYSYAPPQHAKARVKLPGLAEHPARPWRQSGWREREKEQIP